MGSGHAPFRHAQISEEHDDWRGKRRFADLRIRPRSWSSKPKVGDSCEFRPRHGRKQQPCQPGNRKPRFRGQPGRGSTPRDSLFARVVGRGDTACGEAFPGSWRRSRRLAQDPAGKQQDFTGDCRRRTRTFQKIYRGGHEGDYDGSFAYPGSRPCRRDADVAVAAGCGYFAEKGDGIQRPRIYRCVGDERGKRRQTGS